MSRDIAPFGLRMPTDLKSMIDAAATDNNRSINAEVIVRLQHSFESRTDLASASAGALIEEIINRLGAHVQIVVSKEAADQAGIGTAPKTRANRGD